LFSIILVASGPSRAVGAGWTSDADHWGDPNNSLFWSLAVKRLPRPLRKSRFAQSKMKTSFALT